MNSRPLKQRHALYSLYYEKQLPSRDPTILHYQVLHCLGVLAFLARRALIPEAESNLRCPTRHISARIIWLPLHLTFLLSPSVCMQHGLLPAVTSCVGSAGHPGQGAMGRTQPALQLWVGRTPRVAQTPVLQLLLPPCSPRANSIYDSCTLGENKFAFWSKNSPSLTKPSLLGLAVSPLCCSWVVTTSVQTSCPSTAFQYCAHR